MYSPVLAAHFVQTDGLHIGGSYGKKAIIDGKSCMLEVLFDTDGLDGYTSAARPMDQRWGCIRVKLLHHETILIHRIRRYHNQISRVKESLASSPSYLGSPMSGPCQQDCPLVLVGNNSDRVSEREVSTEEGYALAKELGCEFFEVFGKELHQYRNPIL